MTKPFCDDSHIWLRPFSHDGEGRRSHSKDGKYEECSMPTAEESYRTTEPCGHTSNFQIGDERGNFTCTVCQIKLLEASLKDCADVLEAEINARNPSSVLAFPSMQRDYDIDMTTVYEARAILGLIPPSATDPPSPQPAPTPGES